MPALSDSPADRTIMTGPTMINTTADDNTMINSTHCPGGPRTDAWQRGFAQGKGRGARFHSLLGPVRPKDAGPRDQLRRLLADTVLDVTAGRPVDADARERLRTAAVKNREHDWDGAALAAVAYLADRLQDPAARAWLPVMLAGAGRYADAVALDPGSADGRPAASDHVVLVSALCLLGRADEARQLMDRLRDRFPGLARDFVTAWDDTDVGRRFADRLGPGPGARSVPVFWHLPFSGGTSMIVSLKQTVPWAARIEVGRRFGLYQIERARELAGSASAGTLLVHLHHPFPLELPGRESSYFTVLRDPVSQLASGFYKRRDSANIVPTADTGSADLAEHADYTIRNGLTNMLARQIVTTHPDLAPSFADRFRGPGAFRTIAGEEDMAWFDATRAIKAPTLLRLARETLTERFHLVGSMRYLAAAHLAAAASVGLPVARTIVHRGRSGRPTDPVPSRVEARLRSANAVDQLLYEEFTERFEHDHSDLIAAVDGSAPAQR